MDTAAVTTTTVPATKGDTANHLITPGTVITVVNEKRYFAIRKGVTLQNCLFFNWQDAQDHVDSSSEWEAFESLTSAEHYLCSKSGSGSSNITTTTTTTTFTQERNASDTDICRTCEKPPTNHKKRRLSKVDERHQQHEAPPPRKIHAKWMEMLQRLKSYHLAHGTFDVVVPRKLRGVDRDQDETEEASGKTILRMWLHEQDQQFTNLKVGRKSTMTTEKIQLLRGIGYEFKQVAFHDYLAQLRNFMLLNPDHPAVPISDPLSKWTQEMKIQLHRLENGKKSSYLTPQQAFQLKNTGYFTKAQPSNNEQDPEWDVMFEKLKEYKKTHGHCLVNTSNWKDPLVKWVLSQRRHYLTVEEGGTSSLLTTKKLMKLHSIGFVFRQKDKYKTFEQRIDELKEYKLQHGNLRVPTNTQGLGAFVAHARDQYRLSKLGKKHTMNDEKFQTLLDLGFEFKVGKTPVVTCPRLNWDERFQQLLQYKQENGDTIVPQHFSGYNNLGAWVKTQRGNYKLMKKGARSAMTAEMALKLSEIGFVWEVSTGSTMKRKPRLSQREKSGEICSSSDSEKEDEPVSRASVGMLALGSSPSRRISGNSRDESRRYLDIG
jgi:Helicase associated domain